MAVIKVFTPNGVKTVQMLGNVNDQPYDDEFDDEDDVITDDGELTVGIPIE